MLAEAQVHSILLYRAHHHEPTSYPAILREHGCRAFQRGVDAVRSHLSVQEAFALIFADYAPSSQ